MYQEIGHVETAQECQWFCHVLYADNCTWFFHDKTNLDCKIFEGSPDDMATDCKEKGYASYPDVADCPSSFDTNGQQDTSGNGCYVIIKIHIKTNRLMAWKFSQYL